MTRAIKCSCGGPVALYCHTCEAPVCWKCLSPRFLVAHCRPCASKHEYHTREPRAVEENAAQLTLGVDGLKDESR